MISAGSSRNTLSFTLTGEPYTYSCQESAAYEHPPLPLLVAIAAFSKSVNPLRKESLRFARISLFAHELEYGLVLSKYALNSVLSLSKNSVDPPYADVFGANTRNRIGSSPYVPKYTLLPDHSELAVGVAGLAIFDVPRQVFSPFFVPAARTMLFPAIFGTIATAIAATRIETTSFLAFAFTLCFIFFINLNHP